MSLSLRLWLRAAASVPALVGGGRRGRRLLAALLAYRLLTLVLLEAALDLLGRPVLDLAVLVRV